MRYWNDCYCDMSQGRRSRKRRHRRGVSIRVATDICFFLSCFWVVPCIPKRSNSIRRHFSIPNPQDRCPRYSNLSLRFLLRLPVFPLVWFYFMMLHILFGVGLRVVACSLEYVRLFCGVAIAKSVLWLDYALGDRSVVFRISEKRSFSSSPRHVDWLWGLLGLIFGRYRWFFHEGKASGDYS
jgi:hypothetical protein